MSNIVNLDVEQGTDFYRVFTIYTNNDIKMDLRGGWSLDSNIRKYANGAPILSFDINIIDEVNGKVSIGLSNAVTDTLTATKYVYDIGVTTYYSEKHRVVEGILQISPNVTK